MAPGADSCSVSVRGVARLSSNLTIPSNSSNSERGTTEEGEKIDIAFDRLHCSRSPPACFYAVEIPKWNVTDNLQPVPTRASPPESGFGDSQGPAEIDVIEGRAIQRWHSLPPPTRLEMRPGPNPPVLKDTGTETSRLPISLPLAMLRGVPRGVGRSFSAVGRWRVQSPSDRRCARPGPRSDRPIYLHAG